MGPELIYKWQQANVHPSASNPDTAVNRLISDWEEIQEQILALEVQFRMKAYLHPKVKPTPKHWYAYDVVFDGETIITNSRDPDHDLARALLARGIKGKVTLHDGNTGKPRTIINVEKAAKRRADDVSMRVRDWRPFEARPVRGHSPEEPMVLPTMPSDDDAFAA